MAIIPAAATRESVRVDLPTENVTAGSREDNSHQRHYGKHFARLQHRHNYYKLTYIC